VVRYDRLGAGLSARTLPGPPSIDLDTRVLQSVIDACGDEPATVLACSCSAVDGASRGSRTRTHPEDRLLRELRLARAAAAASATRAGYI